jgi:polyisoprenoid-binding protein YceI
VTRPVTFNVTLLSVREKNEQNAWMVMVKAGTTIRRSDFGMDTLSRVVNDQVELCMIVAAFRYRG